MSTKDSTLPLARWTKNAVGQVQHQSTKKTDIKFGDPDKFHHFDTTSQTIHSKEAATLTHERPEIVDQRHLCHIAFGDRLAHSDSKSTSALCGDAINHVKSTLAIPAAGAHVTGITTTKTNFKYPLDPVRFDSFKTTKEMSYMSPTAYDKDIFHIRNIEREKNRVDLTYNIDNELSNIPLGDVEKTPERTSTTKDTYQGAPGEREKPRLSTHFSHFESKYAGGSNDSRYENPYSTVHMEEYPQKQARLRTPLDTANLRERSSIKMGDSFHNKTLKSVAGNDYKEIPLGNSGHSRTKNPAELCAPSQERLGVIGALKGHVPQFTPPKTSMQHTEYSPYKDIEPQHRFVVFDERNASSIYCGDERVRNFTTSNSVDFQERNPSNCRPPLPDKKLITRTTFRLAHGDEDTQMYDPNVHYSTTHGREFHSKPLPPIEDRSHCYDSLIIGDRTREGARLLNSKETTSHYSYSEPAHFQRIKATAPIETAVKKIIQSHPDNSDIYTTTNDQYFRVALEDGKLNKIVDRREAGLARQSFMAEDSIPRGDPEQIKCGESIYTLSFVPPATQCL
jgi:hypothetical protein